MKIMTDWPENTTVKYNDWLVDNHLTKQRTESQKNI